ncbi:MAG: SNF2-related protein, partial [Nanoarchaeota archaeon]
ETSEDAEYQRMMKVLINKKAERDVFHVFKHGENAAIKTLDKLILEETDENIRQAYSTLHDTYRNYLDFELIGVNKNFVDTETGQKNVLPSLHQKIGIYHILKEGRFGIWDGGGTGKTAIGTLAQPLIEAALRKQGKEFRRALVVCPNVGKKTWRKGLLGKETERYLEEPQNVIIIDGDKKDEDFLEALDGKKWIVANYEQLTTQVNGGKKLFVDALIEKGVDYVIFDESHNIKALRETTTKGKPSHSAAARMLALNSEYFVPMSATPISNGLVDFAVQYHLLNPLQLRDPEKFTELIRNSPRILYTFFNEKSVRRNAEDINENLDWSEKEHIVELDPLQREIYEHIIEFRSQNWLPQARKCLLDPRLVDPDILKRVGA